MQDLYDDKFYQAFIMLNQASFMISLGVIGFCTGFLCQLDLCCNVSAAAGLCNPSFQYGLPHLKMMPERRVSVSLPEGRGSGWLAL